jgi:hypothetical protein
MTLGHTLAAGSGPSLTQTLATPATLVGCVRVETVNSPSWVRLEGDRDDDRAHEDRGAPPGEPAYVAVRSCALWSGLRRAAVVGILLQPAAGWTPCQGRGPPRRLSVSGLTRSCQAGHRRV